jgi:hypothetical protein
MTLRASRWTEFIPPHARPTARDVSSSGHAWCVSASQKDFLIHTALQVGKYLVTPLTRPNDDGRFCAAVSIRSGTGSMTHDRVLRFVPVFDTSDQASSFATDQALAWLGRPASTPPRPPQTRS